MKKIAGLLLSSFVVLSLIFNVTAVESVPSEVIQAKHSVVRILAEYSDAYYTGSGFVIQNDGDSTLLVTNHHVVQDHPINISIWISEDELIDAEIIADSKQKDLCILRVNKDIALDELKLSSSGALQGDAVYAVGFPAAADYLSDDIAHTSQDATITDGIVSALRDTKLIDDGDPTKILQISAALNSGNSGGPLFNTKGEVVGINTYGISDSQGIFGAIDVSELKTFLADNAITYKNKSNIAVVAGIIILSVALLTGLVILVLKLKANHKKSKSWSISLRNYMESHPEGLDVYDAVSFLLPVALQIRDQHNNGAPHLQISPDTIQISKAGIQLLPASQNETDRYTSGFAAPEIYKGQSAGILSDMYSFCAVLLYVVTGKAPANAISREEGSSVALVTDDSLNGLADILAKGLSLCPEDRLTDFQNLIYQISRYNVRPYTIEPPKKVSSAEKEKRQKRHKNKIRITKKMAVATTMVLLSILVVGYTVCHITGLYYAKVGNPEKTSQFLFIPRFTKIIDRDLGIFAIGSHELVDEKYEAAKQHFREISGELSADEMAKEADYRFASSLVNQEKFDDAITIFEALGDFKDSAEKISDTQFAKGQYLLYKKQAYNDAVKIFESLAKQGYPKATDQLAEAQYATAKHYVDTGKYLDALRMANKLKGNKTYSDFIADIYELTYQEAVSLYREANFSEARFYFDRITSQQETQYKESKNYYILLNARVSAFSHNILDATINSLLSIINFEDAREVLLYNEYIAAKFLEGNWRTNDGKYFTMDMNGSISYNLPHITYGSYYGIENGKLYFYPKENENAKRNIFSLNVHSEDRIDVYCYKDGSTHTLYRQ